MIWKRISFWFCLNLIFNIRLKWFYSWNYLFVSYLALSSCILFINYNNAFFRLNCSHLARWLSSYNFYIIVIEFFINLVFNRFKLHPLNHFYINYFSCLSISLNFIIFIWILNFFSCHIYLSSFKNFLFFCSKINSPFIVSLTPCNSVYVIFVSNSSRYFACLL